MEGAGYGGSTQGENVYLLSHLFQVFFMGNAKALLFIND